MDIAKKDINYESYLFLIYIPVFYLIYHLVWLRINGSRSSILLEEFVKYRNIYYYTYTFLVLLAGFNILVKINGSKLGKGELNQTKWEIKLISRFISAIIITTFSYYISFIIAGLWNR